MAPIDLTQPESSPVTNSILDTALAKGQDLLGETELPKLLQDTVLAVAELCPSEHIALFLLGLEGQVVRRVEYDAPDRVALVDLVEVDSDLRQVIDNGPMKKTLRGGKPCFEMAILHGQEPKGIISIVAQKGADFTAVEDSISIVLRFAASALANITVFEKINSRVDVLESEQKRLRVETNNRLERIRLVAMSELAAAVAHQLNNPLTTILADTEMLLSDQKENTTSHRALTAIRRAARRAAEVVHRLMAVSNPNVPSDSARVVDIRETIEDVLHILEGYIESESIELIRDIDDDLPELWVAPDALSDVWFNLLMNARDELVQQNGGVIGIEVKRSASDEWINVVIWDDGSGVPEQDYDMIFEPFYTTKSAAERTGLGLHICRQIITSMGGDLSVSRQQDGGARFTVRLPVQKG
jgi:signal transduction histidine kinase